MPSRPEDFVIQSYLHRLLPIRLRGTLSELFCRMLLWPARNYEHARRVFYSQARLRIQRVPQVYQLRDLLNTEFDPIERRITITDGANPGEFVVNVPAANNPTGPVQVAFAAAINNLRPAGSAWTKNVV